MTIFNHTSHLLATKLKLQLKLKLKIFVALSALVAAPMAMGAIGEMDSSNDSQMDESQNEFTIDGDALLAAFSENESGGGHHHATCPDAKFTDAQKTRIHETVYQFHKEKIQLDANLKKAKMEFVHGMLDARSDRGGVEKLGAAVTGSVTALVAAIQVLQVNIMMDVLQPAQRGPAMKCFIEMMKHHHHEKMAKMCKKHHGGHPGGGQPGHDHPGHGRPE